MFKKVQSANSKKDGDKKINDEKINDTMIRHGDVKQVTKNIGVDLVHGKVYNEGVHKNKSHTPPPVREVVIDKKKKKTGICIWR